MKNEAEIWAKLREVAKRMFINPFEASEDAEFRKALLWVLDFPLVPVKVDTVERAILMGRIRDTGRDSFSNDHTPFDEARQRKFWQDNKDTMTAYLFRHPESWEAVAYSATLLRDGKYYTSNAVLPAWRGRGYGKAVLHFIVNIVEHDCWATALLTNKAARREHNIVDWEQVVVDEIGGLVHFHTWRGRK